MITQRTRRIGIMWTAFSADLRRERSLWATYERGSYVGNCWRSASLLMLGLKFAYSDENDHASETFGALADLCIFGRGLSFRFLTRRLRMWRIWKLALWYNFEDAHFIKEINLRFQGTDSFSKKVTCHHFFFSLYENTIIYSK